MKTRLALLALAVLAALGLWQSARHEPGPDAVAYELASRLRCPDCQGVSAAESSSAMAESVRAEIGRLLREGRSAGDILGVFEQRYGPWILLDPPATGLSAVLWALPVTALVLALLLTMSRHRRPRRSAHPRHHPARLRARGEGAPCRGSASPASCPPSGANGASAAPPQAPARAARGAVPVAGVVAVGLAAVTAGVTVTLAGHRAQDPDIRRVQAGPLPAPESPAAGPLAGRPPGTTGHLPDPASSSADGSLSASGSQGADGSLSTGGSPGTDGSLNTGGDPDGGGSPYTEGLALIEAGRPAEAVALLRPLRERHPRDPDLLLLLGTAELTTDPPQGRRTLRRFLRLAPPDHPAAPRIQRLLP